MNTNKNIVIFTMQLKTSVFFSKYYLLDHFDSILFSPISVVLSQFFKVYFIQHFSFILEGCLKYPSHHATLLPSNFSVLSFSYSYLFLLYVLFCEMALIFFWFLLFLQFGGWLVLDLLFAFHNYIFIASSFFFFFIASWSCWINATFLLTKNIYAHRSCPKDFTT